MAPRLRSKVYFFFINRSFTLKNRNSLKKFITGIFKKEEKRLCQICYIFCSDADILKLNKKYLSHNYYTDILTFDLSENKKEISAEVYISIDRIKDNAQKEKVLFQIELYRVLFHGALHLCGYNDNSPKEIYKMRKREDYYLSPFIK